MEDKEGNDKADEAATIGMKNGTRLKEARVAQSLQLHIT